MRVLGIDPGLRSTGWGLVDVQGSKLRHVANGQCQTPPGPLAGRLLALFEGLSEVSEGYGPGHAAVEQTFVNRDGAGCFLASPYDKTLPIQVHKTGHAIIARSCLGPWTGGQEPVLYRTIEYAPSTYYRRCLYTIGLG